MWLLKVLISRHYDIHDSSNETEKTAFLKYIDEKNQAFKKTIETK